MDARYALTVVYTDTDGNPNPAHISSAPNESGAVDLLVFVSAARGDRMDQAAVPYSAAPSPNTWANIQPLA